MECTMPRVNSNVNYRLQVTVMCQFSSISVADVPFWWGCWKWGRLCGDVWDISVPSSQFCCGPKTGPKNKLIKIYIVQMCLHNTYFYLSSPSSTKQLKTIFLNGGGQWGKGNNMKSRTYLVQDVLFVSSAMMNQCAFWRVFLLPGAGRPDSVSLFHLQPWVDSTASWPAPAL